MATKHSNPGPVVDDDLIEAAWYLANANKFMLQAQLKGVSIYLDPGEIERVQYLTCCALSPYFAIASLPIKPDNIKLWSFIKHEFGQCDVLTDPRFSIFRANGSLDKRVSKPTQIEIPFTGTHAFCFALVAKTEQVNESPYWSKYTSSPIVPDHSFVVFQNNDEFRIVQGFYGHYTYKQFAADTEELESFIPICPKPTLKNWHGQVCPKPKYRGTFGREIMIELLQDLELLNGPHNKDSPKGHHDVYAEITAVMLRKEQMPNDFIIKALHVPLP